MDLLFLVGVGITASTPFLVIFVVQCRLDKLHKKNLVMLRWISRYNVQAIAGWQIYDHSKSLRRIFVFPGTTLGQVHYSRQNELLLLSYEVPEYTVANALAFWKSYETLLQEANPLLLQTWKLQKTC